jgi:hypothetical protein
MRTRIATGIELRPDYDRYGQQSTEGVRPIITDRRLRRWSKARNKFYHRPKNGIHDPFTFFHLVEELANIQPARPFSARDLTDHLNHARPMLVWDAIAVGRILGDLIEQWGEANPGPRNQPLVGMRNWNGRLYQTTAFPEAARILLNTLDDLVAAGDKVLEAVTSGQRVPRTESPLTALPTMGFHTEGIA